MHGVPHPMETAGSAQKKRQTQRKFEARRDGHEMVLSLCQATELELYENKGRSSPSSEHADQRQKQWDYQATLNLIEQRLDELNSQGGMGESYNKHQETLQEARRLLTPKPPKYWVHRRDITLTVRKAPVRREVAGAYVGGKEYVANRLGYEPAVRCLGIQAEYRVQVVCIEHNNNRFDNHPHVMTPLQVRDQLYYAAVAPANEELLRRFEAEVVEGKQAADVVLETMEFMPAKGSGLPAHVHQSVIGAKEHRKGNDKLGALYFRDIFGNLAIHKLQQPGGEWVVFPGPEVVLSKGARAFMACCERNGACGSWDDSDNIRVLMEPDKFRDHVERINEDRDEQLHVILPRKRPRWADLYDDDGDGDGDMGTARTMSRGRL